MPEGWRPEGEEYEENDEPTCHTCHDASHPSGSLTKVLQMSENVMAQRCRVNGKSSQNRAISLFQDVSIQYSDVRGSERE